MHITTEIIDNMVKMKERYYVPGNISGAIERCLENDDASIITSACSCLCEKFNEYVGSNQPADINYTDTLTLDAYTANYLCRNMFIPSIALRDLAYHPQFQNLPTSLKVLDLGSGTGAVTLGLLSMFSRRPLSRVSLKIIVVDRCVEALNRQRRIISEAGFDLNQVEFREIDMCNTNHCINTVQEDSPFHLVFLANCLTEMPPDNGRVLLESLPEVLDDNGAIIIAEPPRDYTLGLIKTISANANNIGLKVYYPCPTNRCPHTNYTFCWVWRYHEYEVPDIMVNGQPLEHSREELVAGWLILTKQNISIYDTFKERRPDLSWGPIPKDYKSVRLVCYGDRTIYFTDDSLSHVYKRGHFVGISDEGVVEEHYKI